jgi:hypothetical protein
MSDCHRADARGIVKDGWTVLSQIIRDLRDEAFVDGDQRRRVGKRDETNPQPPFARDHFNSSVAVTTDWATSAIFLLSFIAVLRSRA